ncbi:MAG: hypothetical protein EXR71_19725 [Myxococcales bacterium]|nr:hypothetical protein [Myxococcales bacterium]
MSLDSLASQTGTILQLGDAVCEGGVFWHMSVNPETCDDDVAEDAEACVVPWTADGLEHDFGCTADPACEFGERQHYVSDSISPIWEAASWFDPSAGTLWLAGGTTGCGDGTGDDMSGADLYVVDPTAPHTLNAVNLPGLTATSVDVSHNQIHTVSGTNSDAGMGPPDGRAKVIE